MSSSTSTIIQKNAEKSKVNVHEDITLDNFSTLRSYSIDESLKKPSNRHELLSLSNIQDFYLMMKNSLEVQARLLPDKYYTPVYFSYTYGSETIGGCAIWIMSLKDDPPIKFAYFYGLHRFPGVEKKKFSSHLLLRKVITYCLDKQLAFICLPRPCMVKTTLLWYSLGMTFDLENDLDGNLRILKTQTKYDESYFSEFQKYNINSLNIQQQNVSETIKDIHKITGEIFDTTSLTTTAGLLFADNYNVAINKCNVYLQNSPILEGGAIKKTKNKKQKTKNKKTKKQKNKKTKKQKNKKNKQ
jgi:hypothetical protein